MITRLSIIVVLLFCASLAQGQTVTPTKTPVSASKDTFIRAFFGDGGEYPASDCNGGGVSLLVGQGTITEPVESYVSFDWDSINSAVGTDFFNHAYLRFTGKSCDCKKDMRLGLLVKKIGATTTWEDLISGTPEQGLTAYCAIDTDCSNRAHDCGGLQTFAENYAGSGFGFIDIPVSEAQCDYWDDGSYTVEDILEVDVTEWALSCMTDCANCTGTYSDCTFNLDLPDVSGCPNTGDIEDIYKFNTFYSKEGSAVYGPKLAMVYGLPTETPTITPTTTPTATPTTTPTDTPTSTPTSTPTETPTQTPTWTPTLTPTVTPTWTFTHTPTDTPTSTPTHTFTNTPTSTPTYTSTSTPTLTPTQTSTITRTFTPTRTPTETPRLRCVTPSPTSTIYKPKGMEAWVF